MFGGLTLPKNTGATDIAIAPNDVFEFGLGTQSAWYELSNAGQASDSDGGNLVGQWQNPVGGATSADYDVRFSLLEGYTPTGVALDTWLTLGTTRRATITQTALGVKQSRLKVEIRVNATAVVVSTAEVLLQASRRTISGGGIEP